MPLVTPCAATVDDLRLRAGDQTVVEDRIGPAGGYREHALLASDFARVR